MSMLDLTEEERGLIRDALNEFVKRYSHGGPDGRLERLRDSILAKIPYRTTDEWRAAVIRKIGQKQ